MSGNPTFHTRAFGAYSQSDVVTREGQYPDRFGQYRPAFAADDEPGETYGTPSPALDAFTHLQRRVGVMVTSLRQLDNLRRARSTAGTRSEEAWGFQQAQIAAREAGTSAMAALKHAHAGRPSPYELQRAEESVEAAITMIGETRAKWTRPR